MSNTNIISLLQSIDLQLTKIADAVCTSSSLINKDRAYRREEAARVLGVSTRTVDVARKKGLLEDAARLGARYVRITGASMQIYQSGQRRTKVRVLKL